jgi:hypothetical protein
VKKRSELKELLSDVLAEEVSAPGRADLLAETLLLARRKRHRQVLLRGAASVTLLLSLCVWFWPVEERVPEKASASSIRLVVTEPLSRSDTVESRRGLTPTFDSSAQELVLVETQKPTAELEAIDDQQLLTLVNRPAALVRRDARHAELVFANAADREQLRSQ